MNLKFFYGPENYKNITIVKYFALFTSFYWVETDQFILIDIIWPRIRFKQFNQRTDFHTLLLFNIAVSCWIAPEGFKSTHTGLFVCGVKTEVLVGIWMRGTQWFQAWHLCWSSRKSEHMFESEGAILRQARPHGGYVRSECVQTRLKAGSLISSLG